MDADTTFILYPQNFCRIVRQNIFLSTSIRAYVVITSLACKCARRMIVFLSDIDDSQLTRHSGHVDTQVFHCSILTPAQTYSLALIGLFNHSNNTTHQYDE